MNLERFVRERRTAWSELEGLVASARHRPERLGFDGVRRLGALYRAAAADLSLARRRWPDDPARARLETLVARARQLVYHSEGRRRSAVTFFTHTYWQRVTEAPVFLAASAVLLFGPMLIGGLWGLNDAPGAIRFVPREYASVAEHEPGDEGRSLPVGIKAAFSSAIFTNNVRVTFVAFAGGILLGLGTAAVLLFNGALLGAGRGASSEPGDGAR